MWGALCRLQLLLSLASAVILGFESSGTRDYILLPQIPDFPFCRLLRLAGLRWRWSTTPSHVIMKILFNTNSYILRDCLCGLVIRVPGYRSRDPEFDSRRYQIFWEVEGLEWGPLSLVSTTEELLGRNSRGSGLENREYSRGDPLRRPRYTLYPQKLALTSPTCGGRTVGIVRLRTKTTEFLYTARE
jgi:hypothetical protein